MWFQNPCFLGQLRFFYGLAGRGAGRPSVAPPPWPGPFPPWDPRNFCGPFFVFVFFPPPSSGSRAVHVAEDSPPLGAGPTGGRPSSFPKSAPMVGGGPLPKGRGGFAPYARRGLLPESASRQKKNNRGKATPRPPALLTLEGEGVGGKLLGNNPEQVLNLGYCFVVAGFPPLSLCGGCGLETKIKIAVFLCEGRRKSLRRPSGFDPEFICSFSGPPPWVLILSVLGSAEAEAVFFYFSPWWVEQADVNVHLIAVAVSCRCVSRCVQSCILCVCVRCSNVGSSGTCLGRSNDVGSNCAAGILFVCSSIRV